MLATIVILLMAFYWLLRESDCLRVRLPVGKDRPRYGVGRTIAQWEEYDKVHTKELERERKEYAERQAVLKSHTCPICKTWDDNLVVETKTISYGNSTCHIRGCPACLEKYRLEIEKSQRQTKPLNHTPSPII